MSHDAYYRHSGEYEIGGTLVALLIVLLAGSLAAAAYAYLILYIPFVYLNALLTVGFGGVVATVAHAGVQRGRIRAHGVAIMAALVGSVVVFYVHWAVWLNALLNRAGLESALLPILLSPGSVWQLVAQINELGAWSIRGATPTGGTLWSVWGIEAALFMGVALLGTAAMFADTPFCEQCGTWCRKQEGVCFLNARADDELKQRLEQKDIGYLAALGPAVSGAAESYRFDIDACPQCGATNALDVKRVTRSVGTDGSESTQAIDIIENLLLAREEADRIRAFGERLSEMTGSETA